MSRGRGVADADRDVRQYLVRIAAALGDALGERLAGLYVHGALATGSFRRERSGVDLIAVTGGKLSAGRREALARVLVQLSDARPLPGDIDVAVIQERYARGYVHPVPYEVHYSARCSEELRHGRLDFAEDRTDAGLAACILETRERGVTLLGPPPGAMFGPVPWHAYVNSLEADFHRIRPLLSRAPAYAVLAACRILHGTTSASMKALNEDEAALWALQTVPRGYRSIVDGALQLYRGTTPIEDAALAERDAVAFCEYVGERSQPAFARASESDEEEA